MRAAAALLLAAIGIGIGCGPAQSREGGGMSFGLFNRKVATTVHAAVGAPLQAERAYPAGAASPSAPLARAVSLDALPPTGVLQATRAAKPPAEAFLIDPPTGTPAVALVNTYDTDRRTATVWQLGASDPTRLAQPRAATFDSGQSAWVLYGAQSVLPLPGRQALIHLRYHQPRATDGLFLYDVAADRMRALGAIEPDWSRGVPFQYLDALTVRADAVLVRFHTDKERLGPERYVNRVDHLVLFSPRHRDGLEVLTLGIDDGNVRRWALVGQTLWLETADDRARPPTVRVWSLDLQRVL